MLAAAEETRISALAAAIVSMRRVLDLQPIDRDKLPSHHRRAEHVALVCPSTHPMQTAVVRELKGLLVLDDHGQVKILSGRSWRGRWRTVTLWRDGVEGVDA